MPLFLDMPSSWFATAVREPALRGRGWPGRGRRAPRAPGIGSTALGGWILALLMVPVLPPSAAAQDARAHALGTVHFPISCSPPAQAEFNRGVALLHHMMYTESRQAFETVHRADPRCAMAHWGTAMTLFQPLWPARPGAEALRRGWQAVQEAKRLGPVTDREQAFIAAAEAFFREPGTTDWWTRIRRWAAAMEAAYRAHPDDLEVAAFYALSHLAAGYVAEDRMAHQARAAEILLHIHAREPAHPGALHYTIHANDVDGRSGESLDLVRRYGDIAPDVPHALHMPTHIFVRLGAWPDAIEWNRRSADAALRFAAGHAATQCGHYIHAMAYLLYAHLQRGQDREAGAALDAARRELSGKTRYQQEFVCAFHLAAMPARYALERGAWAEAASLTPRSPASLAWDRYPWAEAITWFARGLGAIRSGDLRAAQRAEMRMRALGERARELGEQLWVRYIEIDRRILAGGIAHAEGNVDSAVALLRAAAELERTVQKDPVTPGALVPPSEVLGDLLLEVGRPAEALEAYESSLRAWPRRLNALLGAARAARSLQDWAKTREYYTAVLEVTEGAATERSAGREARSFLARESPDA